MLRVSGFKLPVFWRKLQGSWIQWMQAILGHLESLKILLPLGVQGTCAGAGFPPPTVGLSRDHTL